jgi:hypothetical protein
MLIAEKIESVNGIKRIEKKVKYVKGEIQVKVEKR